MTNIWVSDQEAMIAELRRGRIRVTIDVFEKEPLDADHSIRDLDKAFLTPHISGFTVEIRSRLVEEIAMDIQRFFAGELPRLAVSADRLKIMAAQNGALFFIDFLHNQCYMMMADGASSLEWGPISLSTARPSMARASNRMNLVNENLWR